LTSIQAPKSVVMIRPHKFLANPETKADNKFQSSLTMTPSEVSTTALHEFDTAVNLLETAGVTVHVFDDLGDRFTPDSVFPNNWFSTHAGGHVAVYPMFAESRRRERRWDVIEMLKQKYRVQDVIDYSGLEADDLALEGTGAMVIDHVGRVAYVAKSNRADPVILERFCTNFNFEPMAFRAEDETGTAVYHTNVMMTIATDFALICLDMIIDPKRREMVVKRLKESGHEIVDLSFMQIREFAGNAIELSNGTDKLLAISARALDCLDQAQRTVIEKSTKIIPISIPTIETAGGSVRCTIAGIHLARR